MGDQGNEVCNFEGSFIGFKQEEKKFNLLLILFELLDFDKK